MEKQKLPHSQGALILGIVSIITACCCYGVPGLVLGFIGMKEAKKAKAIHEENPEMYTGLGNADTGRITSIIGIVIGLLLTLMYVYMFTIGKDSGLMQQYKDIIEQAQQNQ
jgi:uncharacterized membrane protein